MKDLQKQIQNNQENANRNICINNYLNVKGLNAPTKDTGWLNGLKKKKDPYICLQENHFRPRDTYRLRVKGLKKIFHVNENQKKARVAILISDRIDLKIKNIISDKEGHYKMIRDQSKKKT